MIAGYSQKENGKKQHVSDKQRECFEFFLLPFLKVSQAQTDFRFCKYTVSPNMTFQTQSANRHTCLNIQNISVSPRSLSSHRATIQVDLDLIWTGSGLDLVSLTVGGQTHFFFSFFF